MKTAQNHSLIPIVNKTVNEIEILNETREVNRNNNIIEDFFNNSHMDL